MAVKLKPTKRIEQQWKAYTEHLEKGGLELPEMEALRPFMGARGGVSKRATRSNKQKAAFNLAVENVRKKHGQKRKEGYFKKQAAVFKARQTRGENAVKQQQRRQHKKQTGKALTTSAKKTMEEAQNKYDRMLEILTEGSKNLLSAKVRYEIYKKMDAEKVSDEDIQAFIEKLLETLEDYPDEAKDLAKQDSYVGVLLDLREFSAENQNDFSAMFSAIVMNDPEQRDNILNAVRYWQTPENNPDQMGFEQFWSELEQYNDWGNEETYREILQGDKEEE